MKPIYVACLMSLLSFVAFAAEPVIDPAQQQLLQALDALDLEAQQNNSAALERLQARQAADRLQTVRARDKAEALEEAQVLLKTAEYSVKIAQIKDQLILLDRERDNIMVEASKRDAALARKESERLRMQALALEEQQLQAQQMADAQAGVAQQELVATDQQTKRVAEAKAKEAALIRLEEELQAQMAVSADDVLKGRTLAGKAGYILSATAFDPGTSKLSSAAKEALRQLTKKLKSSGKTWSIEGHMDALGDETENLLLSKKRADAVLVVLKSAGVASAKLRAKGLGSSKPIANNQSKSGRAQNRRVEIIQK
jgi:outer membrane protein OmpA-like peptidoglycan-associated protein